MDLRWLGVVGLTSAGVAYFSSVTLGVGALAAGVAALYVATQQQQQRRPAAPTALDPSKKIAFRLVEREVLTHDTRRLRFALQSPAHVLGLPVGKHMDFSATIGDKLIVRSYTPVSSNDDVGYFDLVIKVYRPLPPKFPDGGKLSQYLDDMKVGDSIDVRGPTGHIEYTAPGTLLLFNRLKKSEAPRTVKVRHIGMMAGGTGITPMLQVIRQILKNPNDKTKVSLIFANKSEEDILLRAELEEEAKDPRLSLWFTIDSSSNPAWKYSTGFINEDMISKHLPGPEDGVHILMCGPPPMVKFACIANLEKLGFKPEQFTDF